VLKSTRVLHERVQPNIPLPNTSAIAANMRQIIYGALLVILMLFRPQGFIGEYAFKK
jgi:branched-chain amino acid transport system permease protein